MIHEQWNKRIEVVFALGANAFKAVAAVERTLNSAEDTFLDG